MTNNDARGISFSRWLRYAVLPTALSVSPSHQLAAPVPAWPSFRGPNASGVADGQNLPASWDVRTGQNIRWTVSIPGLAHSSPIVWGDRLYRHDSDQQPHGRDLQARPLR